MTCEENNSVSAWLQDPGNEFEKKAQNQQAESAQKTTQDPRSAAALYRERQEDRNEPQQQGEFQDHWRGLYIAGIAEIARHRRNRRLQPKGQVFGSWYLAARFITVSPAPKLYRT